MHSESDFWSSLYANASASPPKIAFPDAHDHRVLQAVSELIDKKLISPVLVGPSSAVLSACAAQTITNILPAHVAPALDEASRRRLAGRLSEHEKQGHPTLDEAVKLLDDPLYHAVALLLDGAVDGIVAGSTRPTADVVRAAIQFVGTKPSHRIVSGQFLIESADRRSADGTPFIFADCAVMPEPSARSLAAIAAGAAEAFRFFTGKSARVALLSFSTKGSAEHPLVDRLREALAIARKQTPELQIDGELQSDAAIDPEVARIKNAGPSPVAGHANVFVFPTLEAGNISYKLVQRFSRTRVAGPILWGLNKPVSDLSRGCTVREIADTALCVSSMIRRTN